MRYSTRRQAVLSLIEFSPAMRALHKVIPRMIDGRQDGWTVVMR